MPSQCCCNGAFETPDTFLLVPRPSPLLLCNFTYKPRWNLSCTGRIWKPSLTGFKIIHWMYKLKFHFVNGSCLKCFCLHWLHSIQQTFCLSHFPKTFWNYVGRRKLFTTHSQKFRAVTPCEAWRNAAICSVLIYRKMYGNDRLINRWRDKGGWVSLSPSKVLSLWQYL